MRNNLIRISGVLGIVLGIAAAVIISIYPSKTLLNTALAGIALILLLVFFVFHYEAFKAFSRKRSTHLGLNSILMIVLFLFIAVVFNLIARQHYFRFDLSSTASYSLAAQTRSVVSKLDSELMITVFSQEGSTTFKRAGELLEGYRHLNKNIVYSVLDLDRAPLLAKEYGVSQYDSIVVKGEGGPVVVQGISEETITNAVIKATRRTAKNKKIYFITGHGERDPNGSGREGMSKAVSRLKSIGYEAHAMSLAAVKDVPEDAAVLVMAGPREKLSSDEAAKLDNFTARGGRLIALLESRYDPPEILVRAGINLRGGVVVDPSSNLGGKDEKIPLVSKYPDTPVTRDFKLSTVYPGAAPLLVGGKERDYEYFTVVSASPDSRLMKDGKLIPGEKGEHVIAAAAGSRKGKSILMAFGDSDFASNAFFDVLGNGNLFLNCVNWMAEEGELVSITPRKDDFIPLYITPEQGRVIMYASVLGIPLSVFGLGLFIWVRRRRL